MKRFPPEAIFWFTALVLLGVYYPDADHHFTLCPFAWTGFSFCPGCGLGRSISYAFHGEFRQAFQAHPLGIFAILVLSFRIIQLTKNHYYQYGKNH